MAALRSGLLTGDWSGARYRRWVLATLPIGVLGSAVLAWITIAHGFDSRSLALASLGPASILRPAMAFGYAAAIILLARPGGWLTTRVAAAGRMAFTNYVATSLISTTLFYGYGFGWFGQLGRAELYWLALPIWALMLGGSPFWLRRYRYGPLEWLWRSLARGRVQPMRISA